ncbi:MAG: asparagine synthetase B, partial [Chlamydiia bacterium]|nr:asparagine synthetase B [Chlamydiia bacterium]
LFSPGGAFNFLKHARSNIHLLGYIKSSCIFEAEEIDEAAPALEGLFNPDYFVHRFHNLGQIRSPVSRYQYLDFKTRLPDLYSMQYERLTMACGLKWRTPFLDKEIIDYLATHPEPKTLLEKDTASLLKKLVDDTFPEDLINRPKKTRKNFLSSWVEKANLEPLFQILRDGALIESGILSEAWIMKATKSEEACCANFPKLWSLFTLEIWFRLFINFPVSKTCPTETLKELISRR